ncbi:MAG: class I SAM-dependent methyltransferase [Rhodospirillales bacterium]|nr:class I SAM-dependent methyltransferase [Rhodospirillales bacterium]
MARQAEDAAAFDASWLALREPYDAAARAAPLARRFAAGLPPRPRILDLGAGTGSLFRWLAPRIGGDQHWVLADSDTVLLDHASAAIADWAAAQGWGFGMGGRAGQPSLLVITPRGIWHIERRLVDLARPPALAGFDGVVCSALLDLVSAAWIARLAGALRAPLLACLTVDGRDGLRPGDPRDRMIAAAFRRDQARDKGFGRALGTAAAATLRAALAARDFEVAQLAADWRIPPRGRAMLATLIAERARVAAWHLPGQRAAIAAWEHRRLGQIMAARLAMRVGHIDTLALPRGRRGS